MTITLAIDADIPLPIPNPTPSQVAGYRERAAAAVRVIQDMVHSGGSLDITEDDSERARQAAGTGSSVTISEKNAAVLVKLEALLTKYDVELLDTARRLQNYVLNRLIEESNSEDAKIRLRALELLGKTSVVGSFSENVNVNVTHKSVPDVDNELARLASKYVPQDRLRQLLPNAVIDVEDAQLVEPDEEDEE